MNACCKTMAWLAVIAAVIAGEAPAQTAPDPSPSNAVPGVALDTPEYRDMAGDCVKARQTAEEARRTELRRLIQVQMDEADALLKEKKKAGNVKGIAIATQTRQMFESALTALESTGSFELPEKVRRELEDTVRHFNGVRSGIEAKASNEVARIQKEQFERIAKTLARLQPDLQGANAEAAFAALVDRLLTAPPPPPPATVATNAVGTNAVGGATDTNAPAGAATNAPASAALPEILGMSGPADRWVTAGRVLADMMSVDVLEIPLANQTTGTNRFEKTNPITDQSITVNYVSLYPLPARTGLVYRLKRVPDREGVEILDWPSPRNNFSLTVRTMPSEKLPVPHGFEVQVSGPDAMVAALFSGAPVEATSAAMPTQAVPIVVTLISKPSGAAVLIDGRLSQGSRTPCRLRLPPGTQSLRLTLPGYVDGVFSSEDIRAGKPLTWTFQPDPRIVRKTVVVPADSKDWVAVAEVQEGARIALDAQGSWSCASGAMTGLEGYPNNEANFRFYMNPADYPRQTPGANFGALVWRIAPKGRPSAVGRALRTTARESGMLQLDINEASDPKRRADNSGALSVSIVILPPAAP